MAEPPNPALGTQHLANLPGARTSCTLLTVLTVLLAWPSPPAALPVLVRPAYFALLFWFFQCTARRSGPLRSDAMRLVCAGFLVLWLAATASAVIHFGGFERDHAFAVWLRLACDHGAMALLGTTLLAYGLMLWIPQVVESHRRLGADVARQSGALRVAETTRSHLEQRLVEADRRAILGELAATIAHDLRNPLTIVKGTAESLCRRQRGAEEVAAHTDVIRRNVEKADRTIGALLALGRPRASAPAPVAAREVLQEVLDLLQIEGARRRVGFDLRAPAGEDPPVHVDRALLAQALLNLLLNALQASPPGSTVVLRTRRWRGRAPAAVLAVEDRGSGLPGPVREQLFQPFFTTKPGGTGLGLLSCRRIAGELGGRLGLFPRHRGGARALLLLPAAPAAATTPQAEEAACRAGTC
ncbi:MAG: hypothetical protein FJ265_04505 [Planctomycetes bacterium]|nr:hypothetical protein [Planctomycetota bacterium]